MKIEVRPLVNRKTVSRIKADSSTIWEQASAKFGQEWWLIGPKIFELAGTVAWIKEGLEVFPGATYHLDLFHLRRRLTEALGF